MTEEDPSRGGAPAASTALYLVMCASCPALGGARVDLTEVDEVLIARGERVELRHTVAEGVRRLTVFLPDTRISSRHARLVRLASGWVVEDLGSKNGSRLDGGSVKRGLLAPGAVLEIGATWLTLLATPGPTGHLLAVEPCAPGLETLLPHVASEHERLASVAIARVPLLILGESGTGKELAARAAHELSGRRGRFVAVNCGALPATLLEAELFGHRRGAFSGATEDRTGLVRGADRGTLFLDEIGDLAPASQAALLRVLQEGEVTPIGESAPVRVDIRVVAATHRDLEQRVEAGLFRADLLARLDGHRVRLPPLRERRADLGVLVRALLAKLAPSRAERVSLTPDAGRALLAYEFPRNVRELEQALAAALALAGDHAIGAHDWPERMRASPPAPSPNSAPTLTPQRARLTPEDEELRGRLERLFEEHRGNLTAVAKVMGKDRTQVRRYLARVGLDPERWR